MQTERAKKLIFRLRDLQQYLGLSRATIWRLAKAGKIPASRQISPGVNGWIADEITEWLAARPIGVGPVAGIITSKHLTKKKPVAFSNKE